jgi:hypothetical protein
MVTDGYPDLEVPPLAPGRTQGGVLRRRGSVVSFAIAGCLLAGVSAKAGPVTYASFSGTVINFDGLRGSPTLGAGEILTDQFASQGVTFSVPNFAAYATDGVLATDSSLISTPNVIWVDQGGGNGGSLAQGLYINFSMPQSVVGMFVEGSSNSFSTSTVTLAVYDGSTLIESLTSGLEQGGPVGLEGYMVLQDPNITQAIVYSTRSDGQNWNFEVDNLKFSNALATPESATPEPSPILLIFAGLAVMAVSQARHLRPGVLR